MTPYWEDKCPECGGVCVAGCRCPLNDRVCDNGHTWRRDKDTDEPLLLDTGHGKVIKRYEPQVRKLAAIGGPSAVVRVPVPQPVPAPQQPTQPTAPTQPKARGPVFILPN